MGGAHLQRGDAARPGRAQRRCAFSGHGETVPGGPVEVLGYAFAGGERHVARVDVSLDGGVSWSQADLLEDLGCWACRHWRIVVDLVPGDHEIVVRAWDSSAAT